jgi:glucose-1-phosphate adenylyltransferase
MEIRKEAHSARVYRDGTGPPTKLTPNTNRILSVIMGGGAGTRLFPLTKERAKPAVPLAGKYRLVDIPISNCINSELRRIYILTQFNSASLHRHISQSYKFDHFTAGFVDPRGRADVCRHVLV